MKLNTVASKLPPPYVWLCRKGINGFYKKALPPTKLYVRLLYYLEAGNTFLLHTELAL